jgi:DNA-directed RNA polymerase specialized sigma24 family protein
LSFFVYTLDMRKKKGSHDLVVGVSADEIAGQRLFALETHYRAIAPSIERFLQNEVGEEAAKELIQRIAFRFLRSSKPLRGDAADLKLVAANLWKCAGTALKDYWRGVLPERGRNIPLEDVSSALCVEPEGNVSRSIDFETWLSQLSDPRFREVLELRYVEGLTWEEMEHAVQQPRAISRGLHSVATARRILPSARSELSAVLWDYEPRERYNTRGWVEAARTVSDANYELLYHRDALSESACWRCLESTDVAERREAARLLLLWTRFDYRLSNWEHRQPAARLLPAVLELVGHADVPSRDSSDLRINELSLRAALRDWPGFLDRALEHLDEARAHSNINLYREVLEQMRWYGVWPETLEQTASLITYYVDRCASERATKWLLILARIANATGAAATARIYASEVLFSIPPARRPYVQFARGTRTSSSGDSAYRTAAVNSVDACIGLTKFAEAAEVLTEVMTRGSLDDSVAGRLAWVHFLLGNVKDGRNALRVALRWNRQFPDEDGAGSHWIARCFAARGDRQHASAFLRRAMAQRKSHDGFLELPHLKALHFAEMAQDYSATLEANDSESNRYLELARRIRSQRGISRVVTSPSSFIRD